MKNVKIVLLAIAVTLTAPQLSFAISGSGISDAITNNLNTNNSPSAFIQDSAITAYIHAQLVITKNVPSDIGVTTKQGIVKLEGTVESKKQANDVIKVALSAKGVKVVDASSLKIKQVT